MCFYMSEKEEDEEDKKKEKGIKRVNVVDLHFHRVSVSDLQLLSARL